MEWHGWRYKGGLLPRRAGNTSVATMSGQRKLWFYLDDDMRQSAMAGQHNFIRKVETVLETAGYRVEFCRNTLSERLKSTTRRGYSMFHMDAPLQDRSLTFRRVYHYPFWAIEPSNKRWEWHVVRTNFPASDVPRNQANRFYKFWQNRLFGSALQNTSRDGFVYVPLQGRLLDHRSFQTCSPLDMVRAVLRHDLNRKIIAALHPKEHYTPEELSALDHLQQQYPRLSVRTGGMEQLLQACDYIVTQNSGAAFNGYFYAKPVVLFGQIDFHHIAANVADLGVAEAIRQGPEMTPDYAGYVHWFWQIMSINAGREEAENQIRSALTRAGLPM